MASPSLKAYSAAAGQPIHGGRWPGGRLSGGVVLGDVSPAGTLAQGSASVLSGGVTVGDVSPSGTFAAASLPTWVPSAGGVTAMTRANGLLTNNFIDIAAPYFYQPTVAKIRNDYSTSVANPYFGSYGALIFFGAGHAAASDNTLGALVLGQSSCTFRRLIDPSPIAGSGTDGTTQSNNTLAGGYAWATMDWAEATVDGKPAAPHSYGVGDVIGPADGGATHGTFFRVLNSAAGYGGDIAAQAAHKVDFANATGFADGVSPSYAWARVSKHPTAPYGPSAVSTLGGPNWSAFAADQNRVYYEARAAAATIAPRWYDITAGTWNTGSGSARPSDVVSAFGETGVMFAVPERHLVVFSYRRTGNVLGIAYLDTTNSNPSWVAANLTSAPGVVEFFGTACWCKDNDRIVVGELTAGNTTLAEVEIPATLTDPWVCSTYSIGTAIAWVTHSSYKSWTYNATVKAIVYPGAMSNVGASSETVFVHRPRNT